METAIWLAEWRVLVDRYTTHETVRVHVHDQVHQLDIDPMVPCDADTIAQFIGEILTNMDAHA